MLDEINNIRSLISTGRVDKALDRLDKFTSITGDYHDDLLMIRSSYATHMGNFHALLISNEEFSSAKAKVSYSLINLIKKIEEDYLDGNWLFDKQKVLFDYYLSILSLAGSKTGRTFFTTKSR